MIHKKAEFFFKKKITIHLKKHDGQFYNGLITEISENHLIINDRMVGETFIDFSEIIYLEPFKERRNFI